MTLAIRLATADDAPALAVLHTAVADALTATYGKGHWSSQSSEAGVLRALREPRCQALVACDRARIVGTLRLVTKKPWAIDVRYFTPVRTPLYLLNMAVSPDRQRAGIGRQLVDAATNAAHAWPAEGIRLDAYDAPAGAGEFYAKCGYTEVGRVSYRGAPLIYYELVL
jgi:predicted N-acetyltransferase YhbS